MKLYSQAIMSKKRSRWEGGTLQEDERVQLLKRGGLRKVMRANLSGPANGDANFD